ncbi:hypothetical protein RSSM_01773 [Rhodopirellula sallentina SM41]|uniref:Uncharacterized protein n=1 Tax=Rhodopirellula sallentina SM41 TaxID=1263870 RepID=M5U5V4_9BACT|nr:hypothetical protein RSSM_01773 [Rhodopirellula sallentina SM41]
MTPPRAFRISIRFATAPSTNPTSQTKRKVSRSKNKRDDLQRGVTRSAYDQNAVAVSPRSSPICQSRQQRNHSSAVGCPRRNTRGRYRYWYKTGSRSRGHLLERSSCFESSITKRNTHADNLMIGCHHSDVVWPQVAAMNTAPSLHSIPRPSREDSGWSRHDQLQSRRQNPRRPSRSHRRRQGPVIRLVPPTIHQSLETQLSPLRGWLPTSCPNSRGATALGQPWVSTQGPVVTNAHPSRGATTVETSSERSVAARRGEPRKKPASVSDQRRLFDSVVNDRQGVCLAQGFSRFCRFLRDVTSMTHN